MVGLDPAGIKMVKKLFKNLSRDGVTIFMSTHTLSVAEDVCDRIGIIHKGRLLTTGTPVELKEKTQLLEADFEDVFIKLTTENNL
jgi:ABC-2 type transport system ATP-binding protein